MRLVSKWLTAWPTHRAMYFGPSEVSEPEETHRHCTIPASPSVSSPW